jgi:hypothetical protein
MVPSVSVLTHSWDGVNFKLLGRFAGLLMV